MRNNKQYFFVSIISFLILFIVLLGFYPGVVSYDGNNQWQQVQREIITNGHPFFSTFFMLLLSKIWNSITVVVIYQILLMSVTWGYLCKTVESNGKKQKIIMYIFTVITMLCPLISIYSITVWKDTLYTLYLFLCAIILFDWSNNNYIFTIPKYCLFGLMIAMVYSYRYNGIIIAILILIMFYIINIRLYKRKVINKSNLKKCVCVFLSFIIIISAISIPKKILLESSNKKLIKESKKDISYSTIDSYMVWMMGAHIKDGNITDKNDIKFLNNIIPLKDWGNAYNPYLINGTGFVENFDKKYLVKHSPKFERIFIKYSTKYPLTIFNHYLKADALLIDPLASYHGYVYVYCFSGLWSLPDYTVIRPKINFVNRAYNKIIGYSMEKPLIMFYQPAFILYLSLFLTVLLAIKVYGKKIWLFSLPMILNIVSLLPINLAQDLRYVYINYLTFFGLLLMFFVNYKKIFKKSKKA